MKKSLLVLPAVLLLLAACTPPAGGGGGGGNEPVRTAITLTVESLLGFTGEQIPYHDSTEDKVVGGMSFGYVELAVYLSKDEIPVPDGLQWRNNAHKEGGKISQLFNTTIGENETIESLVLNYNPNKNSEFAPTGLEVMSGTTSQKDVATGAGTIVATQIGKFSYTVNLPAGTKYFKLFKAIAANGDNFGAYLNSIVVNTVK